MWVTPSVESLNMKNKWLSGLLEDFAVKLNDDDNDNYSFSPYMTIVLGSLNNAD